MSPTCTLARLNTAPAPVTTPQPIRAAAASGISAGMGMHWFSPTTVCCTKAPMLAKLYTGCPCSEKGWLSDPNATLVQLPGSPPSQSPQWPQLPKVDRITWSPTEQ